MARMVNWFSIRTVTMACPVMLSKCTIASAFGIADIDTCRNGQPWPQLQVEPRKYRFRVLNGAVSRSRSIESLEPCFLADEMTAFSLSLHEDLNGPTLEFDVIASDGGMSNVLSD
jgi:FtsP/CotA-like multicopper oxidase with cupredoxin domain